MKFLNKIERKFGKYAINNLIMYILAAYAVGYVTSIISPGFYSFLTLKPELVFKGQIWRLFTWICTKPQEISIFLIFMFMFYYWIGMTLERNLGTFRYNLYIFSGWFFMTVGSLAFYLVTYFVTGGEGVNLEVNTYYINLASFLAFATLFPDMQVYFMMIIPIKIKWLAIVDLIFLGYEFISNLAIVIQYSAQDIYILSGGALRKEMFIAACVSIVISILNYALFYLGTRNYRRISPREIKRKREFRRGVSGFNNITKHKCAICGRTEADGEGLVFRFCSKCDGNYEYCQDHLFTHEHVVRHIEE